MKKKDHSFRHDVRLESKIVNKSIRTYLDQSKINNKKKLK